VRRHLILLPRPPQLGRELTPRSLAGPRRLRPRRRAHRPIVAHHLVLLYRALRRRRQARRLRVVVRRRSAPLGVHRRARPGALRVPPVPRREAERVDPGARWALVPVPARCVDARSVPWFLLELTRRVLPLPTPRISSFVTSTGAGAYCTVVALVDPSWVNIHRRLDGWVASWLFSMAAADLVITSALSTSNALSTSLGRTSRTLGLTQSLARSLPPRAGQERL